MPTITANSYSSIGMKPSFHFLKTNTIKNNCKFNNGQLESDTIAFSGKNNKANQIENKLLGIEGTKYTPYTEAVKINEKKRRELQLQADTIGIKIDLPNQEDYADAIYTKLEIQRGDNKIKQAMFLYNKAQESNDPTEISKAYENIQTAKIASEEIKNKVPTENKEKSEKVIAQFDEAKQKVDDSILEIKIDSLAELLGEDVRKIIDLEKLKQSEDAYSIGSYESQYVAEIIKEALAAKIIDKKPDEKSDPNFQESIYDIEDQFRELTRARCLGIKNARPSSTEISKAGENYRKALLNLHIITKHEYEYD